MSKVLPAELQSDIRSLRIMAILMAVCGAVTILGIPWAVLYVALAITLRSNKIPNKWLLRLTAFVTLLVCWCIAPIFLEIGLWRVIKKSNAYQSKGDKALATDKEWRKFGFWRKHNLVASMVGVIILIAIAIVPIPYTATKIINVPFKVQYTQDASIELGESQTRQPGSDGQGLEQHRITKPLFAHIFGVDFFYKKSSLPTQTTQAPTNQIVAQGTKKYQYMWCSNGSYRYYTNDQFTAPNAGFTHKSADFCAQNGQGHMTSLADSAPPQQTTTYVPSYSSTYRAPTYTNCHSYTYTNSFSCTSY